MSAQPAYARLTMRPIADSIAGATANGILAFLALRLMKVPQESLPAVVWAASAVYVFTIAPAVMLCVNLILASRDFRRGLRLQAVVGAVLAFATVLLMFGTMGMD